MLLRHANGCHGWGCFSCGHMLSRKRKAEELEETRKKEEQLMEERRKELLNEEDGYWRKRMAAEQEQRLLVDGISAPADVSRFLSYYRLSHSEDAHVWRPRLWACQ